MNKKITKIIAGSLFLVFPVLFAYGSEANAATFTNNITIEGNAQGLVTIPDTYTFLAKDNIVPGDEAVGTIKLTNNYDDSYEVFIRAEDGENKSNQNLLNALSLNLKNNGTEFYSGNLTGEEAMSKNISLGIINPGETRTIDASILLDGEKTGNEYKNKYASIDWIISASKAEKPQKGILKLGDKQTLILLFGTLTIISGTIAIIVYKKRRGNCEA